MTWEIGVYLLLGILFTFYLEKNLYEDTGTGFNFLTRIRLILLWPFSFLSWLRLWLKFFFKGDE